MALPPPTAFTPKSVSASTEIHKDYLRQICGQIWGKFWTEFGQILDKSWTEVFAYSE
jgi:hypothetical protein